MFCYGINEGAAEVNPETAGTPPKKDKFNRRSPSPRQSPSKYEDSGEGLNNSSARLPRDGVPGRRRR